MIFEQITVGEFLHQTLTCQAKTPIQDILDALQSQLATITPAEAEADVLSVGNSSDLCQIVVVNEQNQPISLIPLSSLLLAEQSLAPFSSLHQPISEWVKLHGHALECVPQTYSLKQFWQYLQGFSEDIGLIWTIVQEVTGEYLGLLDTPKLVQFLAHQTPLSVAIKFSSDLKSTLATNIELSESAMEGTDSIGSLETPGDSSLSAELLAEVCHEFKSPLTALLSLSNVLSHQGYHNLSERQQQYVQLIHQNSQQLMSIVNNLLDLTLFHTQAPPKLNNMVDLDLLCEDAIAQAKRYFILGNGPSDSSSPTIQRYPTDPIGVLSTNELKLRQTLVHLLHNALGLTNGQSAITLNIEQWQGWIIFTIKDTGIYIPPLSQPFVFQIPQTWTDHHSEYLGKTGLGVILAQRLAQQILGDISFISSPELGNAFSIYVPTDPSKPSPLSQPTRGLVLVIASNPQLIDKISQRLTDRSCHMVIARSDSEIFPKINNLRPEVIVLQTTLTTLSGWDLYARLKQTKRTLPILLIGHNTDYKRGQDAGASGFIPLEALDQYLDQWLDQWLGKASPSHLRTHHTANTPLHSPIPTPPAFPKPRKRTMLHLDGNLEQVESLLSPEINRILHIHHWRVVSTTTTEEAELLANIWQPNVILYTTNVLKPLLELSSDSALAQYPFIILNPKVRKAAHNSGNLKVVMPDSAADTATEFAPELQEISYLLQTLNIPTLEAE